MEDKTVLILGGSGRFGRHARAAFQQAGWRLRLFDRKTDRLEQAAKGVGVIVNGWNCCLSYSLIRVFSEV